MRHQLEKVKRACTVEDAMKQIQEKKVDIVSALPYYTAMNIRQTAKDIVNGKRLSKHDDLDFLITCDVQELCTAADYIRKELCGDSVDLCTIINGKSGANAAITGNYLTTAGYTIAQDRVMLSELGRHVAENGA